jgi:hypothetical protein
MGQVQVQARIGLLRRTRGAGALKGGQRALDIPSAERDDAPKPNDKRFRQLARCKLTLSLIGVAPGQGLDLGESAVEQLRGRRRARSLFSRFNRLVSRQPRRRSPRRAVGR